MRGAQSKTQPGLVRAGGRKRHNRALREERLAVEAGTLGIPVQELKTRLFQEVQDMRRSPRTPEWAGSRREIVH